MNQEHEYALLNGVNRAKIGRYIGTLAASISAGLVFLLLSAAELVERFGKAATIPPTMLSLVSAAVIWGALYWFFDRHAWRWKMFGAWLKVPSLAGEWDCTGRTLNPDGSLKYEWRGVATIVQSWDKIRVRLKTSQSGSNSISAALLHDEVDGYVLLYHYRNDPRVDEPQLSAHRGFAELTFAKDCNSAEGGYFNGHGRNTSGTMSLTRRR